MAQIVGAPVYQDNVRQLTTADPGHPTTFNPNATIAINNDVYLKQRVDNTDNTVAAAAKQAEALLWATRFI